MNWNDKARLLLREKNLKQIDAAAALDCSKSSVSAYLNGSRMPPMEKVRQLAAWLGISMSELVDDDPRFLSARDEVELVDEYRELNDEQRKQLRRILKALKEERSD